MVHLEQQDGTSRTANGHDQTHDQAATIHDQAEADDRASADRALTYALVALARLEQTIRALHSRCDPRIWHIYGDLDEITSRWTDSRADDPGPAK